MGAHVLGVERRSRAHQHERLDLVLAELGRHRDHRGFVDVRVRDERVLDLAGCQVLAAPADHLFLARDERERAVRVAGHEVAGPEPPVDDDLCRLGRHLVVAEHDRRVAQLELACVPDAHLDPATVGP